jgi:hypothetical protein
MRHDNIGDVLDGQGLRQRRRDVHESRQSVDAVLRSRTEPTVYPLVVHGAINRSAKTLRIRPAVRATIPREMSNTMEFIAWASVPLALSLATIHAVFRERYTLWLTAFFIVAALLFSLHSVVADRDDRLSQLTEAVAHGATPEQLHGLEARTRQAPRIRIRFSLYVLAASIVPLFIGEFRRARRKAPGSRLF